MSKLREAKEILEALGLPKGQQNERSALTLLALCDLKKDGSWPEAKQLSMSVVGNKKNPRFPGIMRFIREHYGRNYAENSRETFRRQTLHQFVQAGIVDHNPEDPNLPTNSKDNHYRLTDEALQVVQAYSTTNWKKELEDFKKKVGTLREKYSSQRKLGMIPLKLADGTELSLSPGKHNELQIAIVQQFAPRFASGSILLYLGDAANKDLYCDAIGLESLGITFDQHTKFPDVVLYDKLRKWLIVIEAVTAHGPVSPKRIIELEELLKDCKAGKVYVTAFPDFTEFKRHTLDIAWETEVWLADSPDHMIHFNGSRFIGSR
ncbi:MAG TPA: BsuBI/PstI family type II restriction endonuclease [Candidatus Kryptonia bacterium]